MTGPCVKILVCYHKPDHLFKDNILTPIHVGRTLAKEGKTGDGSGLEWLTSNMIGDDTGENISHKNSSYNELTAIYWAWKNYGNLGNPDYIGLMHYRRHFVFREMNVIDIFVNSVDENYYSLINYSYESITNMLSEAEFIYHEGKVDSIEKHYAENHNIKDLYDAISIIDEIHPSYSSTAHNYLDSTRGSFCNMFIFPKKMFFEYCEWLFSILDLYELTHDLSEKRLFISERLTGIFIQNKIDSGARFKNLPITLIKEPITVPIAMPWEGDLFSTVVTILSHVSNADPTTGYKFYIIGKPDICQSGCLTQLSIDHHFDIEIINPDACLEKYNFNQKSIDFYPLFLHILLPNIDKCVYLNKKLLSTQDESEFYRTCNVDDFWICGIPEGDDDPACDDKIIVLDLLVLNLKRFRSHKLHEGYQKLFEGGVPEPKEILHLSCNHNIGYFPPWFYKKVVTEKRSELFDPDKKRGDLQYEARWSSYVYFNGYSPIYSMQGIYSILWWNIASKVPGYIRQPNFDVGRAWDTLIKEQHKINQTLDRPSNSIIDKKNEVTKRNKIESNIIRFKNAYEKHGLRETMRLGFEYIKGRAND